MPLLSQPVKKNCNSTMKQASHLTLVKLPTPANEEISPTFSLFVGFCTMHSMGGSVIGIFEQMCRDILDMESSDYPSKISDFDADEEIDFIRKNKSNIVAISEVGLDFVNGESKEQIEDFDRMIKLAEELKKPIVVHSRKSEQKCIEMLESSKNKKIIMHCFSGKKSLVKRISDNGWFLSIPTIVVRSQQFQEIAGNIPITQLFCETDSPYLSPYKEKTNEPAFVIESYKKIAEIKNMDVIEVINSIYMNWQKIFE